MRELIDRIKELETRNLSLAELIDSYIGVVDSYLSRFKQEERYQVYKKFVGELRKMPKSKLIEFAFAYVD